MNEKPTPAAVPPFRWRIDLGRYIGKQVDVDTADGFSRRAAVLREVRFERIEIEGVVVGLPVALLLGSDDLIPFAPGMKMRLSK
jgi:hypothetical protein